MILFLISGCGCIRFFKSLFGYPSFLREQWLYLMKTKRKDVTMQKCRDWIRRKDNRKKLLWPVLFFLFLMVGSLLCLLWLQLLNGTLVVCASAAGTLALSAYGSSWRTMLTGISLQLLPVVLLSFIGEEKQERGNWKSEKADYDVLEVVMVYPGEERREEEDGMMGLLKELFCEGGEEKGKRLEEKYGILMTKEMEKEVDRMCNLSQIFVDKGIEKGLVLGESKGKEESNVACVRSLSKRFSINYEEAMDLLEIEEALRPSVMERLHHPKDRETAE